MFPNTGIQSSWANPPQNQQQPQQPQQPQSGSVFGQPSAFSSGGGGGASHTIDTFSLPLSAIFLFVTQLLDLVEVLAKIHNSSLSSPSRRTQCLEILLPILILLLQQGARRLVGPFHSLFGIFLISIHQGHLGAIATLRLVTQSPRLRLAHLEVEGHLPLARAAEHSVRRLHPNRLRQTQAYSAKQIPLGARSELVHLITSRQQARSDRRVVCLQRIFL